MLSLCFTSMAQPWRLNDPVMLRLLMKIQTLAIVVENDELVGGRQIDGSFSGGVTNALTGGEFGDGFFRLNGSGSNILAWATYSETTTNTSPIVMFMDNGFTMNMWTKSVTLGGTAFTVLDDGGGRIMQMGVYPTGADIETYSDYWGEFYALGVVPTDGNWHMITVVFGPSGDFYVDGAPQAGNTGVATINADFTGYGNINIGEFWLGVDHPYFTPYGGDLDDVSFFQGSLSANDVLTLYTEGHGVHPDITLNNPTTCMPLIILPLKK